MWEMSDYFTIDWVNTVTNTNFYYYFIWNERTMKSITIIALLLLNCRKILLPRSMCASYKRTHNVLLRTCFVHMRADLHVRISKDVCIRMYICICVHVCVRVCVSVHLDYI